MLHVYFTGTKKTIKKLCLNAASDYREYMSKYVYMQWNSHKNCNGNYGFFNYKKIYFKPDYIVYNIPSLHMIKHNLTSIDNNIKNIFSYVKSFRVPSLLIINGYNFVEHSTGSNTFLYSLQKNAAKIQNVSFIDIYNLTRVWHHMNPSFNIACPAMRRHLTCLTKVNEKNNYSWDNVSKFPFSLTPALFTLSSILNSYEIIS